MRNQKEFMRTSLPQPGSGGCRGTSVATAWHNYGKLCLAQHASPSSTRVQTSGCEVGINLCLLLADDVCQFPDCDTSASRRKPRRTHRLIVRLGWFRSKDRWVAFEANKRYPRELLAGLHLASCLLHFSGVVPLWLRSAHIACSGPKRMLGFWRLLQALQVQDRSDTVS